jgi:hypothetical protein
VQRAVTPPAVHMPLDPGTDSTAPAGRAGRRLDADEDRASMLPYDDRPDPEGRGGRGPGTVHGGGGGGAA